MKFTKENASEYGKRGGRPPGSHDRHFVRVETWLARYFEDLEELPLDQRLPKMEMIIDKFFTKIAVISASPEESAARAKTAAELLGALEQRPLPEVIPAPTPKLPGAIEPEIVNPSPEPKGTNGTH